MKVLFFLATNTLVTGGQIADYRFCKRLKAEGILTEVLVVEHIMSGFRCLPRFLARLPGLHTVLLSILTLWRLRRYSGKVILYNHYYAREFFFFTLLQKYVHRARVIVTLFHFDHYSSDDLPCLRQVVRRWKEKLFLFPANRIITYSEFMRQEIVSLGINPAKIEVLTLGVDRDELQPLGEQEAIRNGRHLLFVGRLYPRKGLTYLIEAFATLPQKEVVLHLVGDMAGDPAYVNYLKEMVARYSLEGRVMFHAFKTHKELNPLYQQADIFVLPSLREGFGIVLVEAMYYGLPIIATNVSAIPELVVDGENGLLVPPCDASALAQALSLLLDDPGLRRRLGENGRRKAANSYVWDEIERRFVEIVREIAADCI